jgi:hypothetical protein
MMDLLEAARSVLEEANYRTSAVHAPENQFAFEDATVYGFVSVGDPVSIVNHWQGIQDGFIRRHLDSFSRVPAKAWNVYAVFLCHAPCPDGLRYDFELIEEDFRGARKIARSGIRHRQGLVTALAPLLPLRFVPPMERVDFEDRLSEDSSVDPEVWRLVEAGLNPEEIVSALLEET